MLLNTCIHLISSHILYMKQMLMLMLVLFQMTLRYVNNEFVHTTSTTYVMINKIQTNGPNHVLCGIEPASVNWSEK